MGAGLAVPYALAPRLALSALSPAQAGQGSGIVNACTFLGGSAGVAGGATAFALGGFVAVLAMIALAGIDRRRPQPRDFGAGIGGASQLPADGQPSSAGTCPSDLPKRQSRYVAEAVFLVLCRRSDATPQRLRSRCPPWLMFRSSLASSAIHEMTISDSNGALSALRDRIQRELRGQLGRSFKDFRLWQDKEAIAPGKLWQSEIESAVGQAMFFIPIVTPDRRQKSVLQGRTGFVSRA